MRGLAVQHNVYGIRGGETSKVPPRSRTFFTIINFTMQKYDHIELMLIKQGNDYRLDTAEKREKGYEWGRLFICEAWIKAKTDIESDYIVFEVSNKPSKNAFQFRKILFEETMTNSAYEVNNGKVRCTPIFIFATLKRTFELIEGIDVYVKFKSISKEEYDTASWGDYLPESVTLAR
jgi:hypothetical protein